MKPFDCIKMRGGFHDVWLSPYKNELVALASAVQLYSPAGESSVKHVCDASIITYNDFDLDIKYVPNVSTRDCIRGYLAGVKHALVLYLFKEHVCIVDLCSTSLREKIITRCVGDDENVPFDHWKWEVSPSYE